MQSKPSVSRKCFSFQTIEISDKIQCVHSATVLDLKEAQRAQSLAVLGHYLLNDDLNNRDFGQRKDDKDMKVGCKLFKIMHHLFYLAE